MFVLQNKLSLSVSSSSDSAHYNGGLDSPEDHHVVPHHTLGESARPVRQVQQASEDLSDRLIRAAVRLLAVVPHAHHILHG